MLYYFPIHAQFCGKAPLYAEKPNEGWLAFTEDVAKQYSKCEFYLETRSQSQLKYSCENLKIRITEFI